MQYPNVVKGQFLRRINRFIAEVEIDGVLERVHVKNTGRCKELFVPGVETYLQRSDNPLRKTQYSLITVKKGDRLINIDSIAPNKLFAGSHVLPWDKLRPERTFGDSRFDFEIAMQQRMGFVEVKGVTLEVDNVAYFPDAPTLRGVKHINGLIQASQQGFLAYLVFVIQMERVPELRPNDVTHPAFGEALRRAKQAGVELLAYQCKVGSNWITMDKPAKIVV